MEKSLIAVEIINPNQLEKQVSNGRDIYKDLSIDTLLESVDFVIEKSIGNIVGATRNFAKEVLIDMNSDIETAKYRQEVFSELISDNKKRSKIKKAIEIFYGSSREYFKDRYHYSNRDRLEHRIERLKDYKNFLDTFPSLEDCSSRALKDVVLYINKIRKSEKFSELGDLIKSKEVHVRIDFEYGLDNEDIINILMKSFIKKTESRPEENILESLIGEDAFRNILENNNYLVNFDLRDEMKRSMNYEFTVLLARSYKEIEDITRLLSQLDFYTGFSEYLSNLQDKGFDICKPTLLDKKERRTIVNKARNPVVKLSETNKKVVPNDIRYDADKNMYLITGPNNGGKTTYVKMVGLIQLFAEKGLFIPAKSGEISFTEGVYTHFVAPDDINKGEGRYRNELRRMKEIFDNATPYSLVIMDEPCGGTSYEEGQRQSLIILDGFHKMGCPTYFTTHMHPLSAEIENGRFPAAKNLSVEYKKQGKRNVYTYKIKEGSSNKSYGEEIAKEIGLGENEIDTLIREKSIR
ncbi:MAG: hypothetical protein KAK00_10325 [Nanoarchaeota archaeon]|nr:hypothetical protein [Nanoarchaeota archaeon]